MTIYRMGTNTNGGTAAVKAIQFYGDFDAAHSIDVTPDRVAISSQGPYINSRMADVNYKGAAEVGRAVIQPVVWGIVTGGLLSEVAGTAAAAAP